MSELKFSVVTHAKRALQIRVTKLGVLTTDTEEGVTTLTCRVGTEG